MPSTLRRKNPVTDLFASLAIIGLALWLRLANLYGMPVFIDESNHLAWAQAFAQQRPDYPFLMDGKFLLGVLLAQFQVVHGSPLWQARAGLGIISTLSCAASIALGRRLGSRQAGLLAGLLYALLPFAVFHERQVLADPLMAHFGAVWLVFIPKLARKKWARYALLLATVLAGAILAKLTAVVYIVPLIAAAWLLRSSPHDRHRMVVRCALVLGLAGLLVLVVLASLSHQLGYNDNSLTSQQVGFVGCPALLCHGSWSEQMADLRLAAGIAIPAIPIYFGWPQLGLACLAWRVGPRRFGRETA